MTTLHNRIVAAGMADACPQRILSAEKRGLSAWQWLKLFLGLCALVVGMVSVFIMITLGMN